MGDIHCISSRLQLSRWLVCFEYSLIAVSDSSLSYGSFASSALAGQSLSSELRPAYFPSVSQLLLRKYNGHYFPIIHQADVRSSRVQLGEHDVRSHRRRDGTHSLRVILLWPYDSIAQQIFTHRNGTTEIVARIVFYSNDWTCILVYALGTRLAGGARGIFGGDP